MKINRIIISIIPFTLFLLILVCIPSYAEDLKNINVEEPAFLPLISKEFEREGVRKILQDIKSGRINKAIRFLSKVIDAEKSGGERRTYSEEYYLSCRYMRAELYFLLGGDDNLQLALEDYREAGFSDNSSPDYYKALYNSAQIYRIFNSEHEELAVLKKLGRAKPRKYNEKFLFPALFSLAKIYEKGGEYLQAKRAYLVVMRNVLMLDVNNINTSPHLIKAKYSLSLLEMKEIGCKEGNIMFLSTVKKWPDYLNTNPDIINKALPCLIKEDEHKKLLSILQVFLLHNGRNSAQAALYLKGLGDIYRKTGDYEEAAEMYEIGALFFQASPFTYSAEMASLSLELELTPELTINSPVIPKAFSTISTVLSRSESAENQAEAYYLLGNISNRTGSYKNCLELMDIITGKYQETTLFDAAVKLKLDVFIKYIDQIKGTDGESILAYYFRFHEEFGDKLDYPSRIIIADTLSEKGYYPLAIDIYNVIAASDTGKNSVELIYKFGKTLYKNREYAVAIPLLQSVTTKDHQKKYTEDADKLIADAFFTQNDFKNAADYYQKTKEKETDFRTAFNYAFSLHMTGSSKKASALYKKIAADFKPSREEQIEIYTNMLNLFYSQKECYDYISYLKFFQNEAADFITPLMQLKEGECYAYLGRNDKARLVFNEIDNDEEIKKLASEKINLLNLSESNN